MTKTIPNGSAMAMAVETAVQSRNRNVRNSSNVSNRSDADDNNDGKENDNEKAVAALTADVMSTIPDQNLHKSAKDMIDSLIASSIAKISSKGLTQSITSKDIPIPMPVVITEEMVATTHASPRGGVQETND